ncbi:hypothetical protein CPLU01_01819 [Colletotrichum plurivorum]|uniref:Uncharacterized protein n=1 Tax=Colletotrichum plurivorum TaxID=2175906 RepID=A0A8H6KXC4_9PEZI|nr:hypothetical protein CPLU01_01819 [Colletotrichum plurivorum]
MRCVFLRYSAWTSAPDAAERQARCLHHAAHDTLARLASPVRDDVPTSITQRRSGRRALLSVSDMAPPHGIARGRWHRMAPMDHGSCRTARPAAFIPARPAPTYPSLPVAVVVLVFHRLRPTSFPTH